MEFATNFKKHPRKQESFTKTKQPVYKVKFDTKTGERTLEIEKEIDIYEKIQEYKDECNISNILKRYNLDMFQQLKKEEEQLIDLTNLPENLMETMAIIDRAKHAFDMQSTAIKDKFGNDFKKFIAASENGQLATLLNQELKVSAEKFDTSKMANYQGQALVQHKETIETAQPTQVQQPQSNYSTGGNLNV